LRKQIAGVSLHFGLMLAAIGIIGYLVFIKPARAKNGK
tara:strand:- start:20 stop:133 length:114 start_codon:yes stop_codon:yes gene_type:complete